MAVNKVLLPLIYIFMYIHVRVYDLTTEVSDWLTFVFILVMGYYLINVSIHMLQ